MTATLVPTRPLAVPEITVADPTGVQQAVFQATRGQPRPLAGLMTHALDRRNLSAAWDRVSAADGAAHPARTASPAAS